MSNALMTKTPIADLVERARLVDQVCTAVQPFFDELGKFEAEIQIAMAMKQLRELMTPEFMAPIMSLMNTEIGFMTDRSRGDQPPYSVDDVRDAIIDARMRGFHVIGNEFNIISKKFYAAKNGLRRKVTQHPEVFEFKDSYEVPRMVGDRGAIVKCSASWVRNSKPDNIACEFAIRVNTGQGADAILGKAERKLMARIWARLSGKIVPEGEIDDPIDVTGTAPDKEPKFAKRKAPEPPAEQPPAAPEPAKAPEPEPAEKVVPAAEQAEPEGDLDAQTKLRDFVEGRGFTFAHFHKAATAFRMWVGTGKTAEQVKSWIDVPEIVALGCLENPVELVGEIATIKAQEKAEKQAKSAKPKADSLL